MSVAPYLTLISEVLPVQRRDFSVAVSAILNPDDANPLLDGEWLSLDAAYKLVRYSDTTAVVGGATINYGVTVPSFQVFAERGRYDTQAIGKVPVLMIGGYEAETTIANDPAGTMAVNDALIIASVTVGGVAGKKGLKKLPTDVGRYLVVGHVTRISGAKVRYLKLASPSYVTVV